MTHTCFHTLPHMMRHYGQYFVNDLIKGHSHRAKIWDSPPFGLELEKLLGRKFLSKLLRCSAISFYMTRLVNISLVIKRMCLMHSGSKIGPRGKAEAFKRRSTAAASTHSGGSIVLFGASGTLHKFVQVME